MKKLGILAVSAALIFATCSNYLHELTDTNEVEKPVADKTTGKYGESQDISLSCATEGARIYYSWVNTLDDKEIQEYREPIPMKMETLYAFAVKGTKKSTLMTETYTKGINKITFKETKIELDVNDQHELVAIIDPLEADSSTLKWESSDPEVASVQGNNTKGTVTGKKRGTTVITVTSEDGKQSASCTVVVPFIVMVDIPGSTFKIGKGPVTQRQYSEIMGYNPSINKDKPDSPVENVTWYEAIIFCNALSDKEGLTPVYSFNGKTDRETLAMYANVSKDGAFSKLQRQSTANGYRLPTKDEWLSVGKLTDKGGVKIDEDVVREWSWQDPVASTDKPIVVQDYGNKEESKEASFQDQETGFRVVRNK